MVPTSSWKSPAKRLSFRRWKAPHSLQAHKWLLDLLEIASMERLAAKMYNAKIQNILHWQQAKVPNKTAAGDFGVPGRLWLRVDGFLKKGLRSEFVIENNCWLSVHGYVHGKMIHNYIVLHKTLFFLMWPLSHLVIYIMTSTSSSAFSCWKFVYFDFTPLSFCIFVWIVLTIIKIIDQKYN